MNYLLLKEKLLEKCSEYVNERISLLTGVIDNAREAANSETKSSAGDKYETTRSMMQLEQEQNARHLQEAFKLKQVLDQINIKDASDDKIQIGSLVITEDVKFFFAISLGKVKIGEEEIMVVSPVSPIGKTLSSCKQGDSFIFNNQTYKISGIV